jgi:branched-subunit amino acid aminotransferase/4-amino-4-deoxychorismate lyase
MRRSRSPWLKALRDDPRLRGRPFQLAAHLERLRTSAKRVRLPESDPVERGHLTELVIADSGETELGLRIYWTGTNLVATAARIDPMLEPLLGTVASIVSREGVEIQGAESVAISSPASSTSFRR